MNDYPKMIYSEDGQTHILRSENDERPEGNWSDTPTQANYEQQPSHFVTTTLDPEEASAERIARHIVRLLNEQIAPEPNATKRGPGRPPKTVEATGNTLTGPTPMPEPPVIPKKDEANG